MIQRARLCNVETEMTCRRVNNINLFTGTLIMKYVCFTISYYGYSFKMIKVGKICSFSSIHNILNIIKTDLIN